MFFARKYFNVLHKDGIFLGSLSCFLGLLGASLTFPFLQAQRDSLGCDALCYGSMQSVRSSLSLIGTFLIGRLSDRLGRTQVLLLGAFSSLFSFIILIYGKTLFWMWVSMIPSSILNQNFGVMKALFADYSSLKGFNEQQRVSAIGKLGMSAGLAFMVGPLLGATLFTTYLEASLAAIALTIISTLILFFLPQPSDVSESNKHESSSSSFLSLNLTQLRTKIVQFFNLPVVRLKGVQLLLVMRFSMSLAYNVFMVVWTVALRSKFEFGPRDHAFFMGWIGLWYAMSQGFLAKLCISLVGSRHTRLLQFCILCLSLGRVLVMRTQSLTIVYFVMAVVIIALGIMNTAISAACTRLAGRDQVGGLYGMFEATESFGGIIGPMLGGVLQRLHPRLPLLCVVLIYLVIFFAVSFFYEKHVLSIEFSPVSERETKNQNLMNITRDKKSK